MRVGLMLVIRNENKRIIPFLNYHAPYFDEIAICDQQSNDGTWELITNYKTNKVYTTWQDKAWGHCEPSREPTANILLTDWIVYADPDERFPIDFLSNMRQLATTKKYDMYSLQRQNSFDVKVYDDHIAVQPHWLHVTHPVLEKQYRFYRKGAVKYSDKLHSIIHANSKRIGHLEYIIDHRKTLDEQWQDMKRFEEVRK